MQRWIAMLLNGILILLVGSIIYRNRDDLPLVEQVLNLWVICGCMLLYLASLLTQALIWTDMMGYGHGERFSGVKDYIRTTFMGRLPGGVWKILGRMTIYRAPRLPKRAILAINLVEVLLLLIANGFIQLALYRMTAWLRLIGLVFLILTLLILAVRSSHFIPALNKRVMPLRWLAWVAGYMISWLCGGVITYLLLRPFDLSATLTLEAALILWCTSAAVGLLLQILPLSALFRDAALVTLLQPVMPLHRAIVAAFTLRLLMLLSELITGWGLLWAIQLIERSLQTRKLVPEDTSSLASTSRTNTHR